MDTEAWRKSIHMLGALGPPLGIVLLGWLGTLSALLFVFAYVLVGALFVRRGISLPFAALFLRLASRSHERFPVEPLAFVVAFLGLAVFFHEPWFFSAVAVLALGDGVASIAGRRWGRRKLAWNKAKSLEGLVAGVLMAAAAAPLFAWLGVRIHEQGYEASPLLGLAPRLFVALMGASFILLALALRAFTRTRPALRVADASWQTTGAALLAALAAAALPLLLDPVFGLGGPVIAYATVSKPLPLLLMAASGWATVAMVLESFLRGHDNLLVPLVFVVPFVLV